MSSRPGRTAGRPRPFVLTTSAPEPPVPLSSSTVRGAFGIGFTTTIVFDQPINEFSVSAFDFVVTAPDATPRFPGSVDSVTGGVVVMSGSSANPGTGMGSVAYTPGIMAGTNGLPVAAFSGLPSVWT